MYSISLSSEIAFKTMFPFENVHLEPSSTFCSSSQTSLRSFDHCLPLPSRLFFFFFF